MQKHVEAVDSIDMSKLTSKAAEDLKVARRDLIRFVQVVQERMESVMKRLLPSSKRLQAEVPVEKPVRSSNAQDDLPLHEKYKEAFAKSSTGEGESAPSSSKRAKLE